MDGVVSKVATLPRGSAQSEAAICRVSFRRALVVLTAIVASCVVAAQSEGATLQGRVLNVNSQQYLERALVRVEGTQLQALTDKDGFFRIAGLAAGTHTVVVSYAGLEDALSSVTVTADETARVSFELHSTIYLTEEVVVTSPLEGNAYAINQQRRAESVRTVVSVDAFIDQTSGSPGEFLKSVHGVQMDYSQNEPQTPRVRGFDPTLAKVTMDGNEIASAASSGTDRTVQIDQLSIAGIGAVEVYKAPIPSMSANAVGGIINFTTKSAFERVGRRVSLQLGSNIDGHTGFRTFDGPGHGEDSKQRGIYPIGRAEYSNSFLDGRLGLFASIGHEKTNQLGSSVSHNLNVLAPVGGKLPPIPSVDSGQTAELFTEENARVLRGAMSFAPNRQLRERDDITLNTHYKVSEQIVAYLRTTVSDYHSTNRNHGFTLTPDTSSYVAGSTLTSYAVTKGAASQGTSIFDKFTRSWQINPGLQLRAKGWQVELNVGFSKSINQYENPDYFTGLTTTLPNVAWRMETPRDNDTPTSITQTGGLDFYNLNNYQSNQGDLVATRGEHRANHNGLVNRNLRHSWDVKQSVRLDVRRDLPTSRPFYLKGGVALNQALRERNNPQTRYYWVGEDGIATPDDRTAGGLQLGRFAENPPVTLGIAGWSLKEPSYFCSTCLFDYWQANPQVLQENKAFTRLNEFTGYRYIDETVSAGYLMGNLTLAKLNVLAGVRIERTEITATGHEQLPLPQELKDRKVDANSLEAIDATYRRKTTQTSYTSTPFPYLHLRYELTPSLQVRAAYTEAIGRPNFTDILPSITYNENTQTISTNRVGIIPQRSQNVDASVEYYTKSAGAWTVGWFYRDVDHYISSTTIPMTPELLQELNLGSEYLNWQISTRQNLGYAQWAGFELDFRQQLRDWAFVPRVLGGVELIANYTQTYSTDGNFGTATAANPAGVRITNLSGIVPKLFNAGISYRSPGGKLFGILTTNYQATRLTQNLPAQNATAQRKPQQEPYQFWNMELSYILTPRLKLQLIGRNLTKERPVYTQIGIVRNTQQDTGRQWFAALRLEL